MHRFIVAISLCGALAAGCEPMEAKQYNPQSNSNVERTGQNCAYAVADILDIHYSPETGATEKIAEFDRRVKECVEG